MYNILHIKQRHNTFWSDGSFLFFIYCVAQDPVINVMLIMMINFEFVDSEYHLVFTWL